MRRPVEDCPTCGGRGWTPPAARDGWATVCTCVLHTSELARVLGLPRSTVWRLLRPNTLPSTKTARRLFAGLFGAPWQATAAEAAPFAIRRASTRTRRILSTAYGGQGAP